LGSEESLYTPAKYDLNLSLSDVSSQITGRLNYALSLFNEATIERICGMYQRVLQSLADNQQQSISQIDVLSNDERETLLNHWSQTQTLAPLEQLHTGSTDTG